MAALGDFLDRSHLASTKACRRPIDSRIREDLRLHGLERVIGDRGKLHALQSRGVFLQALRQTSPVLLGRSYGKGGGALRPAFT